MNDCRSHGGRKPGIRELAAYYMDKFFLRSPAAQLLVLLVLCMALMILGALAASMKDSMIRYPRFLWWAFLRLTDSGYIGQDEDIWERGVSTVVTLAGLVIFGLLISIISSGFSQRLEIIRRGRRRVLDTDHTVVLGWGNVTLSILRELLHNKAAGDDSPDSVVLLSHLGLDETDIRLENCLTRFERKRLVCRTGRMDSMEDLKMVNIGEAREIIIIRDEERGDTDSRVVKALYGVVKTLNDAAPDFQNGDLWHGEQFLARVALEVLDEDTAGILDFVNLENPHIFVHAVNHYDFIARILAQASIMPGLEKVYSELFSFEGNEVYLTRLKRFGLKKPAAFEDLIYQFPEAAVMGYVKEGRIHLNPPSNRAVLLDPEDFLVLVAEQSEISHNPEARSPSSIPESAASTPPPEPMNVLIIGEGIKMVHAVHHLAQYMPSGSVIRHTGDSIPDRLMGDIQLVHLKDDGSLHSHCEIISRELPADIVMLVKTQCRWEDHDAETLLKLSRIQMTERDIPKKSHVAVEFLEQRNAELAPRRSDAVILISTEVLSHYLVQTLKEPRRARIFNELMTPEGCEICLKPRSEFCPDGSYTFLRILAASRRRGNTALGFMTADGRVVLNPIPKDQIVPSDARVICLGKIAPDARHTAQ